MASNMHSNGVEVNKVRIALTVWNGRIAPVFDVAGTLRLIKGDEKGIEEDKIVILPNENRVMKRVEMLAELQIEILVCGAISRAVHRIIADSGIKIHSFVSGDADEVIQALFAGNLDEKPFSMPGCGMGRRNAQGCRRGAGNRGRGRNR